MIAPIFASVAGTSLSDEEKQVLSKLNPIGISLFSRNIKDKKQLKALISELKDLIGSKLLVAIDQEGGRVRRLAEPCWRSYASQYVLGKLPESVSKLHAELIAEDLREVGINFNYAPVLDRAYSQTHEVLKSRCFFKRVAEHGKVMIDAYCRNAVCPCIKHLPGHGRAQVDPHLGLPIIYGTDAELKHDMMPFVANNQAPAGMTAHIVLPEVDSLPVTMSHKAIKEVIRGRIGFDGLLISDAVDMKALNGTIVEKTVQALNAGCDIACYCGGKISDLYDISRLKFHISDDLLRRLSNIYEMLSHPQIETADYQQYLTAVGKIKPYQETYDATEVLNRLQQS